ncbi:MAG: DinB family protein [Pyrinomonadaceae bacterium]
MQDEGRWSIQEDAGHLLDLETLLKQRLNEYIARQTTLTAADMSNLTTFEAHHNEGRIQSSLSSFRQQRTALIASLEQLGPDVFAHKALHPRLKVQMRLVDMLVFQAEHDDDHRARINELSRKLKTHELPK